MKTKNNIQKTVLAAIVACGLIVLGFAVHAQFATTSFFNDNEATQVAMVTENSLNSFNSATLTNENFSDANVFAAYLVKENDEPLQFEDWMMDETSFSMMKLVKVETESPLEIEDWMTIDSNFGINSFSLEQETEETLEVENWMLSEKKFDLNQINKVPNKTKPSAKVFSTSTFFYTEVNKEDKLTFEAWMTNPKIWKN